MTSVASTICTLTVKDDLNGEYEDDLRYLRAANKHVPARLGNRRLTRSVVQLLATWVASDPQCRRAELMILGTALFDIAFGEEDPSDPASAPMRTAFQETLRTCRRLGLPLRLRLVLEKDAQTLGKYPWEFLFMDEGDQGGFFLAGQDTQLTLTRYVPNSDTWERAPEDDRDGRLRILVVLSTPRIPDMTELKVGDFVDQLLQLDKKRFWAEDIESPTRGQLSKRIEDMQPHVVHFIGHGRPGALALRKDDEQLARERQQYADARALGANPPSVSEADWVDAYTACGLLRAGLDRRDAPQRLVFLHACECATPSDADTILEGFGDVARQLMAGGERIGGVVAMQYTIAVEEAQLFAKAFYEAISRGVRVDEAVRSARKFFAETPLRGNQQSWDSRGWGTPVIYLRSEEALVAPQARPADEPERCPNPGCPGGWVRRSASPQQCRACGYPFIECPACSGKQNGLIVPKAGFMCPKCEYLFESARGAKPAVAPDVAAEVSFGDGRARGDSSRDVSLTPAAGHRAQAGPAYDVPHREGGPPSQPRVIEHDDSKSGQVNLWHQSIPGGDGDADG
jgi:hypothetical protein